MATTKILITGSNGLLGQKLVGILANDPDTELIATSRGENRIEHIDQNLYTYHSLDITSKSEVDKAIEAYAPDVIIHGAAMTNVDQCEQEPENCKKLNVDSVRYLTDAAYKVGAFFVFVSTDFIFDGSHGPLLETDEPNPISIYGQSKLDAETIVRSYKGKWAIARTVLVYGITPSMSRSNIILWVRNSLEEGKKINVVTDQWRTPTLAEDLAVGCIAIAKNNAEGVFNISGEEMLTPYDMAMKTADYFNLDKSLISKADASTFSQPAKRPPKTGFIINKAKELLGYSPRSFDEGIAILDKQLQEIDSQNE
ncbi:SDR family oxidoreductase [Marinigracilibium pacificum]|uniref:dTDP-4-dehydrorhamnose reductase n=1 Tax=Marinigracilibium pacificum TaxID=2729599 RepID=A0A848J4E1_9BACT|nr:SDR family oxidoreductase [Marinigracilibium pacificum]NMM50365.1 SDR family oxidoreductase [Marinigracilibium pacificum]